MPKREKIEKTTPSVLAAVAPNQGVPVAYFESLNEVDYSATGEARAGRRAMKLLASAGIEIQRVTDNR